MRAAKVSRMGTAGLAGALLGGCAKQGATIQGQQIHDHYVLIIILAAPVFLGVEGALLWCILRYRQRRAGDDRPVPQAAGGPRSPGGVFGTPARPVGLLFLHRWRD